PRPAGDQGRARAPAPGAGRGQPAMLPLARAATLLGALSGAMFWAGQAAAAADLTAEQVRAAIAEAGAGRPVDLSGKSLENLALSGLDFRGANLAHANLFGAKLDSADFTAANLAGANLNLAWIMRAKFTRANFSGASLKGLVVSS